MKRHWFHFGLMVAAIGLWGAGSANAQVAREAQLTADDGAEFDGFGWSVATCASGKTAVVGAPFDDDIDNATEDDKTGSVYVFRLKNDQWEEVKKITADDGKADDRFGTSVAISNNCKTIVVGAPEDPDVGLDTDVISPGAAYVFSRNKGGTNNWGLVKKLTGVANDFPEGELGPDVVDKDRFGKSVAISGNGKTIIVGAFKDNVIEQYDDAGSAYIFSRNKGGSQQWGLVKKLSPSDSEYKNEFGWSVAIDNSGNTVVVGAVNDNDFGPASGSAYIFSRIGGDDDEGGAWTEVAKLLASDAGAADAFGWGVAISPDGKKTIVGAPLWEELADVRGLGTAYVFVREDGDNDELPTWSEVAQLIANDASKFDELGSTVSISNDLAVVGSRRDQEDGLHPAFDTGSVYLFAQDAGGSDNSWGQVAKLVASDAEEKDYFGQSVCISGNSVAVGAPQIGPRERNLRFAVGEGKAYIYQLDDDDDDDDDD